MKEESRLSEQIASIQAGLVSAVNPFLREAVASQQAIGNLLSQTLSFYEYIASLSILRVAHVPPPGEGESESEEKEPAFSPGAPSAAVPPPPINVAVAVHLSHIPAVLSEVERCVTEMIGNIPPIQADLAALVSMPASPVTGERAPTEGGVFPLLPGSTSLPAGLQKVTSETTLRDIRTTLLTNRPPELQKVSSERMLRDLPTTLLTSIAADEALTGPLFAPPGTAAPVHHHLHAGTAPEETGRADEPPARPPLTISPLLLLREIMRPAQQETTSYSIPPFPHDITRPAGSEAPPDFPPVWPKTSPQRMGSGMQRTDGKSPDTALAPVHGGLGFTERRSVVQISPLHILSSLMGRPGDPNRTEVHQFPLTVSPSLPVRLLSQFVPSEDGESREPALAPGLSPSAAPPRADIPVPAAEKEGRGPLITPLTPALPISFLNEASLRRGEPAIGTRGQRAGPPSRPVHHITRSDSPPGRELQTTAPPQGFKVDLSDRSIPQAQAEMAKNLLNPVLIPRTLSLNAFSSPIIPDAGVEIGPAAPSPFTTAFPPEVVSTLRASEGGNREPAGGRALLGSTTGRREPSMREGGVTAMSPFYLPSLPLRILTSTSPFTARKGESALKESLSRVHPARFILSLLTGQGTGYGEGLGGPTEPLLFPASEAGQAARGIRAAYGPVLPLAGPNHPQEGIEGGYPGLSQLQQMISVSSGAGTPMQAGSPFSGLLQPASTTVNVIQPPAPPVKVTPPEIRKAAEATARQTPSSGERPVTFHNSFEISVQVKGGGIDGDMHELGRKIGSILADEMRRHGGI